MEILVRPDGSAMCIYDEAIDLAVLGPLSIRRASTVEPDEHGLWWADLAISGGGRMGPFRLRTEALRAEVRWLRIHKLQIH